MKMEKEGCEEMSKKNEWWKGGREGNGEKSRVRDVEEEIKKAR